MTPLPLAGGAKARQVGLWEEPYHIKAVSCDTMGDIFALDFFGWLRAHSEVSLAFLPPFPPFPLSGPNFLPVPALLCITFSRNKLTTGMTLCSAASLTEQPLLQPAVLSCFLGTAEASLHPATATTVAVSCAAHHTNLPKD